MVNEQQEIQYPFQFLGKGTEYFKIWIVNILLSILTLYVYSAWAKVRTNRYFYGNTVLDNSAFEYHATPIQILKGRIIAVVVLIVVAVSSTINTAVYIVLLVLLTILTPWIIWRSLRFNQLMTSYRNVRFNFTGRCWPIYKIFLSQFLPVLLAGLLGIALYYSGTWSEDIMFSVVGLGVLAFYLVIPWIQKIMTGYVIDHSRYGLSTFESKLSAGRYYLIYLLSILVTLLAVLVLTVIPIALIFGALHFGLITTDTFAADDAGEQVVSALIQHRPIVLALSISVVLAYILPMTLIFAYVKTRFRNYVLNSSNLPNHVRLSSTLKVRAYWWLVLSNLLLLIFTLGLAYPWTKVRKARLLAVLVLTVIPIALIFGFRAIGMPRCPHANKRQSYISQSGTTHSF